ADAVGTLRIDWGDGTASNPSPAAPGELTSYYHTYGDNGVYTIAVTGADVYGRAIIPTGGAVTVSNKNPSVSLAAKFDVFTPAAWNPTVSISDAAGDTPTLLCAWDYGDGDQASGPCSTRAIWQPHQYTELGVYTATLTVTDKDGGQVEATTSVSAKSSHYVNLYPVAGTASAAEVTMRLKVWDWATWTEAAGVEVEVSVGATVFKVATDSDGLAEVRVPRLAGQPVEANVTNVPGATAWLGSDSNDLSMLGKPQVDVLFLVDDSGSMSGAQEGVRNNIDFIADQLGAALDYQIGIQPLNIWASGTLGPRIYLPATDSLPWVHEAVSRLSVNPGGELGVDSIVNAFDSRLGLRAEAASCLVLVADEPTQAEHHTVAEAAQALADNDATLYSVVPLRNTAGNEAYRDMARDSGGGVFEFDDFVEDPQPVLEVLMNGCMASVTQRPDLAVSVDDGLAEVALNGASTHTVTVANNGLVGATGVELELALGGPAAPGAISGGGSAAAQAGGGYLVTWPPFSLAAGATTSFTVTWSPAAAAVVGDEVEAVAAVGDDGANGADLTPANNQDSDTTLIAAAGQLVLVVYTDDDAAGAAVQPLAGARTVLVGDSLAAVGFTEAEARAGIPAGYEFASLDNVAAFDDDAATTQLITVHLNHRHTVTPLPVSRTITYTGAGEATPDEVVHEVVWYADTDEATGETLYWSTEGYPEVASPDVDGHTVSHPVVGSTAPVGASRLRPEDTEVVVHYTPQDSSTPALTTTATPVPAAAAPVATSSASLPVSGPVVDLRWMVWLALAVTAGGLWLRRLGRRVQAG
ncbi:MAG: VWA domain-containing protein, partial [Bifidobacteriaceae bacterium]|nr:VWA domain-containing protein [Bifidobacteriaceae bacterium]